MDDMMCRNARWTSTTMVAVVLTQLSLMQLHTWQTRRGGRDHAQPNQN
jgi:cytochrome oxidase assembly protein ShyY1